MIPLVAFVTALVVRAVVGTAFPGPAYPDAYYYANVAQQLAAGHGLTVDYIWNFVDVGGRLPDMAVLPIASNGHWMPLAVFVQLPFVILLGPTSLAAGLPMWLAGAAAAPLTYWIARDMGLVRQSAFVASLLVAVPGGLTPYFGQPDNFGLFMTLGALSLWLCARGVRGDRRAFVLGGLVVGLATLARSDGVLLGLPFAVVALRDVWPGGKRVIGLAAATGCALLFFVLVGPWLYRQLEVFGSIAPSASNGRILWIGDYSELYSIGSPATLDTLLSGGVVPLLAGRLGGLIAAVALFVGLPLVVVLAPLAAIGAWLRRSDVRLHPFFIYAVAFFGASGLLFAVHVPHGMFIHSAVALLPHTFILVVVGMGAAVGWLASRRPDWDARRATAVFSYGALAVAVLGAVVQTGSTLGHWTEARRVQSTLAGALAQVPEGDRLMSADAGAYRYLTGHQGVVTPNDNLTTIEVAARAYGVRWLLLEREAIVPALEPVLLGTMRPAWLSAPVAVVNDAPRNGPRDLNNLIVRLDGLPAEVPLGALYAVCFAPADTRCAR